MDFVREIGDVSVIPEFSVDGFSRAEVCRGRLRVTMHRIVEAEDGTRTTVPVVAIVWTVSGWKESRAAYATMRAMIDAGEQPLFAPLVPPLHH